MSGVAGPAMATQPRPWEVNLQPAGSPIMRMIHSFNNGLLIVVTLITLLVLALLVIVMLRFNARRNPEPSKTSHNTLIEVVWTVLPILILVGIAIPSFSLLIAQHDPARAVPNYDPEKTLTIKATGMAAWYWTYDYPDNGDISFESFMLTDDQITDPKTQPRLLAVDNNLVVPTGTVIRMLVTAEPLGVIHSFAVPSLGFKIDAIPGRLNETWFLVEREGMYYGQCSELCGRNHAFMPIAIQAVSPEKYEEWAKAAETDLDAAYKLLPPPAAEDAEAGDV
ncbi:MAG: cytochrome c oxidase subunit II [Bauldia sp.]|uniref:cytochrome c oxidase subunit II n=1 Tax=Bauldia sp. TaxID=2575872 RepID=UPI001DF810BE|nr:cytochrome c oxidase subunit II [Bauldia sp.]MCB1494592.1 cytochrome c oxidase subunit II [Bauldia sp.]